MVKTLRAQQDSGLREALQREADAQALCYAHGDLRKGLDAVKSKVAAKF